MRLEDEHERYLLQSIARGDAILILGAGASASSTNLSGGKIKTGWGLAKLLAERAGFTYSAESLVDVLAAVRGPVFAEQHFQRILEEEYKGTKLSDELSSIFKFVWRRIYTWNIDDLLERCKTNFAQNRRYYNGLADKAVEFENLDTVHIVHLHGDIAKPEHKYILSEAEYADSIKGDRHYWYRRLAQDYLAYCPIIIGSQIDEPILKAELERAKRDPGSNGRAFLITPDKLSELKKGSLSAKGVTHIPGTLEDFVNYLSFKFPSGSTVSSATANRSPFSESVISNLTTKDLEVAMSITPIIMEDRKRFIDSMTKSDFMSLAKNFLNGFPPGWSLAASSIPVQLEGFAPLRQAMRRAIETGERLFIITGQAGSGKTTAALVTLLLMTQETPGLRLFEIDRNVRSLGAALRLLRKVYKEHIIAYIGGIFVHGDNLKQEINDISGHDITIIGTARSGEWKDRMWRNHGEIEPFQFQRFTKRDYAPLIDRLTRYVPAPKFRKMTLDQKIGALAKSKSQLLIALRETTESENFNATIVNEFERLPDEDTKALLMIVGIATIARLGMSEGMAREAYAYGSRSRSFADARSALDGIVDVAENGRLFARHEIYVRHIIEKVATYESFQNAVHSALKTYVKFEIPIVKSVRRLDAQLFRYLLSSKFILENATRSGNPYKGLATYAEFEIDFQLDGHFWLQYGLYLASVGSLDDSERMLRKSIEAYPQNPFSVHALADIQLRIARKRDAYDPITRAMIDAAVKALRLQDAQPSLDIDEYPIVTLANGHISALQKHGQNDAALKYAKEYFDRLSILDKAVDSPLIRKARERMLRFCTLGSLESQPVSQGARRQHSRRKRQKSRNI